MAIQTFFGRPAKTAIATTGNPFDMLKGNSRVELNRGWRTDTVRVPSSALQGRTKYPDQLSSSGRPHIGRPVNLLSDESLRHAHRAPKSQGKVTGDEKAFDTLGKSYNCHE